MRIVTPAQVIEFSKAHEGIKNDFSFLAVYIGIVAEF